jgi:hypothetical protein
MTFVSLVEINFIGRTMHNTTTRVIIYNLTDNNIFFDFLDNFCNETRRFIEIEHSNGDLDIKYYYNSDYVIID